MISTEILTTATDSPQTPAAGPDGLAPTLAAPHRAKYYRVTIVAEAVLRPTLLLQFEALGVDSSCVVYCQGTNRRQALHFTMDGYDHIRIELLVDWDTAQRILEYLERNCVANFSVCAYADPIEMACISRR
jgi:hypothetical protein